MYRKLENCRTKERQPLLSDWSYIVMVGKTSGRSQVKDACVNRDHIVIGKLVPGQRASAPTDVQLKDSEYKFCKKKLNEVALKRRWTRKFYVEGVKARALLVASRSESSIVSLLTRGTTPSLNRDRDGTRTTVIPTIGSNSKSAVARHHKECFIQQGPGRVFQRVTIESLPDNVLLEIFYFYIKFDILYIIWDWETLVHVCRRWRYVVFGSPIRLDLQLYCTKGTPVRKLLDIWPELPLNLGSTTESELDNSDKSLDNLVAVLEHCDRVREIGIAGPENFLWEKVVTAMDEPFPALRSLWFTDNSLGHEFLLPDTFLNGSAPCLRSLNLVSISFPSLPRLLSSTSDLTYLRLDNIPNSGYIPPETMARCLSALPMLELLSICFRSPTPHHKRRNRPIPPPTRFVLPALTRFAFQGVTEYLEVLAARIDAPALDKFEIHFFHQVVFDIPQIIRFFGHLIKSLRSSTSVNGAKTF
ncbi:hypothetical protein BGW80DRAFT_1447965 [Lactifluus volemus]|nr:hypothetical protein BGW80DRAFT_1447965 [Lactifluus volemus]